MRAESNDNILSTVNFREIITLSECIFRKSLDSDNAIELEAKYFAALLMSRVVARRSGAGKDYDSSYDEAMLKSLLMLAKNWIEVQEDLTRRADNASRHSTYSGVVGVLDGSEPKLASEMLKRHAEGQEKARFNAQESARLNTQSRNLSRRVADLASIIRTSSLQLKKAGKGSVVDGLVTKSGIDHERLRQIIGINQ